MNYTIEYILDKVSKGQDITYIMFWGAFKNAGKYSCLSQWYPCKFTVGSQEYCCMEQYMMAEKARTFNDKEALKLIMSSKDPKVIKALGRQVKNFLGPIWDAKSKSVVVKGNTCKFSQNPRLKEILLSTNDAILVEASPYDTIWGIGLKEEDYRSKDPMKWRGQNKLGFALMEVRDKLKNV